MMREGDAARDWRLLSLVVVALVILIFVANLHLEVRGEVDEVGIFTRFILSAVVSFTIVSGALFLVTLTMSHGQARMIEQALGTLLACVAGAFLFGSLIDTGLQAPGVDPDVWSQFSQTTLRVLIADLATVISFLFTFGLLLTLTTGRESEPDPLLALEATSFEDDEE